MSRRAITPPARPRVALVHKQSLYEVYVEQQHDAHVAALIAAGDVSVGSMKAVHARHQRALEQVGEALAADGSLTVEVYPLGALPGQVGAADLVVVVGGDGTVLEASHHVAKAPLLAINSDPMTSVGYLCVGEATHAPLLVRAYLDGALEQQALSRLTVEVNQAQVGPPVLNDILVAHACPAATSRYILEVGARREAQKSSGLWVSTAAGSTAAIRSAGGEAMALDDQRLQFRVREPYINPSRGYELVEGWIDTSAPLRLISKMDQAGIYLDGPHIQHPLRLGDRVTVRLAEQPLWHARPAPGRAPEARTAG